MTSRDHPSRVVFLSFYSHSFAGNFANKNDNIMTIDELRRAAAVVRDATEDGENTAMRVGTLFLDTIDAIAELDAGKANAEEVYTKVAVNGLLDVVEAAAAVVAGRVTTLEEDIATKAEKADLYTAVAKEPFTTLSGKYISGLGNVVEGGAWKIVLYNVSAGDAIELIIAGNNASGSNTPIAAAWYSVTEELSSEVYLGAAIEDRARTSDGTHRVVAPAGAACFAVTLYRNGAATASVSQVNVSRIALVEKELCDVSSEVEQIASDMVGLQDLQADVERIADSLHVKGELEPLTTLAGKYISGLGNVLAGDAYNVGVYSVSEGDVLQLTFDGYSGIGSGAAYPARWYSATEDLSSENALAQAIEGSARDADGTHRVVAPAGAACLAVTLYRKGAASVVSECLPRLKNIEDDIDALDERVSALEGGGEGETMSGKLNILAIGNSYSNDAFGYLPSVLYYAAPDLDITVATLMDGGQSLAGHLTKINNGTKYTRFQWSNRRQVSKFQWQTDYNATIDSVLAAFDWDIIFFHEVSGHSAHYDNVETYLPQLISALRAKGYEGEFGYIITPAFAEGTTAAGLNKLAIASTNANLDHTMTSDEMSRRIVEVSLKARRDNNLAMVLPCGLALQMARHTPLNRLGDWSPEDAAGGMLLYSDGHHLQLGIGNFIEACAAAITITGGLLNLKPLPTSERGWMNGDAMAHRGERDGTRYYVYTGLDEETMRVGIQCAKIAAADLAQLMQYVDDESGD